MKSVGAYFGLVIGLRNKSVAKDYNVLDTASEKVTMILSSMTDEKIKQKE